MKVSLKQLRTREFPSSKYGFHSNAFKSVETRSKGISLQLDSMGMT